MNYSEALDWLYDTQLFGIKLGLENAHRLVAALNAYPTTTKIIHVAGTNGKGSVCAMAESMARAEGCRTGLFTSPHLIRYNERIKINGIDVSDTTIAEGLTTIRERITDWLTHPTFFEITTALALQIFKRENCEVIILETGMGGRLDATNILTPSVAVLTQIDMDHAHWLGDTLSKIAREKAGIIKHRTPVIALTQTPEVLGVFQEIAAKQDAPLTIVDNPLTDLPLALPGEHQRWNAALALQALQTAGIGITQENMARGLARTNWPGRFQQIRPGIFLDGAHNPAAARMLVETWTTSGPAEKPTILLGMVADKDITNTLHALSPLAASWIAAAPHSARALAPGELASRIRMVSTAPVVATDSLAEALKNAPPPLLVCGSLFLVGEALAFYHGQPPDRSGSQ